MGIDIDKIAANIRFPIISDGLGGTIRVDITRPANATAYTANDVINNTGNSPLRIPDIARVKGGSVYIQGVTVIGDQAGGGGAETWQPRVWVYQTMRAVPLADNAAFTMSMTIARAIGLQTEFLLPALTSPAGSTIDKSTMENIAVLVQAEATTRDLLFDLQSLTAYTPSSGALYSVLFSYTCV